MITLKRKFNTANRFSIGSTHKNMMMVLASINEGIIAEPYEGGKIKGHTRKVSCIGMLAIPQAITRKSGLIPGQYYEIAIYDDRTLLIVTNGTKIPAMRPQMPRLQKPIEIDIQTPIEEPSSEYQKVPLKGYDHSIVIDEEMLEAIGVSKYGNVVVNSNSNSGRWMEVYPSTPADKKLETRTEVVKRLGKYMSSFDGIKYQDWLRGRRLQIPLSFMKQNGLEREEQALLNIWVDDTRGCIIIEGPEKNCGFCDDTARTIPVAPLELPVCETCLPEIEPDGKVDRLLFLLEEINRKLATV
jgi:hypothetical protein